MVQSLQTALYVVLYVSEVTFTQRESTTPMSDASVLRASFYLTLLPVSDNSVPLNNSAMTCDAKCTVCAPNEKYMLVHPYFIT